jgi:phospholipid transport system substrate-binding protein
MNRIGLFTLLLVALALAMPAPLMAADTSAPAVAAPVQNDAAAAVVKGFYATLTEAMKRGPQLGFSGRYKKLAPAIETAFDMPLMTRIAVGPVWGKATQAEQKQLITAFSQFSAANYASQFKAYDGEQFTVTDVKPAADGSVLVITTLKPKGADAVELDYLLRRDEAGNWRIVDVLLAGAISQLAARRAEFDAITRRDGIPALVNSLDEKSKQMGPT